MCPLFCTLLLTAIRWVAANMLNIGGGFTSKKPSSLCSAELREEVLHICVVSELLEFPVRHPRDVPRLGGVRCQVSVAKLSWLLLLAQLAARDSTVSFKTKLPLSTVSV